ncbi:DUF5133 domain-containing protein [Streptomyces luteolus]|uniref:DUF5133 domain-containing protein n=1 Tax=Streptomyces luteolus TaxID=3043615 RepID=A0ABT6SU09_9ACTN|nr:DUF5133 domain-containing protein [Streptomyces sp. B-S-A12]MDI3419103.1 DUF5133 domain-containing protein [Streptomyces sp. B-S-A12]
MLHPASADLRRVLAWHAEAIIEDERHSTPETVRAREDSAYALCEMTGTANVGDAVRAAAAVYRRAAAVGTATLMPHTAQTSPRAAPPDDLPTLLCAGTVEPGGLPLAIA